ncbi:MAG: SCP2 sterol-binding domain-containing protein [Proteobacteria bacterium]|nr:SCP2 sterol-binding domain-containing protein [Pseudomonadota bacterium]
MSAERIKERFEANLSDFAGLGAKVAFDLGEDGAIAIDATVSPPTLSDEPDGAHCTIRISAENLEKLIDGTLNAMMAYTLGKLKIEGSMGVAMKVAALLEE